MPEIKIEAVGVREYGDGYPVTLRRDKKSGRLVIVAENECGNNDTRVDLMDLLEWLRSGPRAGREGNGFAVGLKGD